MPHPSALQCFCQSQLIAFMGVSFKNVNTCFSLAVKVCSFIFCHFNYKLFWCGSFWVHLVWHTLCLLHLDVCFPDFGSFHLLFLQVSSLTFSPLRTPSMQILVYLLFSLKGLKPSAYFLFSVQLHWFLLLCPLMFILCIIWSTVDSFKYIFYFSECNLSSFWIFIFSLY